MNPILEQIADFMSGRESRSAIDPLAIRANLLPYFYILEIEHDDAVGLRLRVRLTGTALDSAFGRSVSGRYLEEFLHGPRSKEVLMGFHGCASGRVPIWMRQVVAIRDRAPRYVEGVAFYVEPELIYGGLVLGDVVHGEEKIGFQSRRLGPLP